MKTITTRIILRTVFALGIAAAAFWLVGWKIWLAMFLMMWANNIGLVSTGGNK
jgi:hypothetical protein